jgi:hypothetical protein
LNGIPIMTTITTLIPPAVATPRGAPWAARIFGALLQTFQRASQQRSAKSAFADRVAEAAATRRYALKFREQNPRFMEDLLAAADRHERGG